jgi:hypothetical protein
MDKVRSSPKDHFMRALCRRGNPGGILDKDWLLPNIGFRGSEEKPTAANHNAVAKRAEEFSAAKARLSFAQAQEKKKAARRGDRRDPITDRRQLEAGSPYLQRRNDAAWMPNSWASSRMS